jgi:hypothetical protein
LRGLVNAGHRRGATVYRAELAGKTVRVVEFPAFAPCALAGIGDLPDTILDRSVIVAMKRRAPHEHVEPFRERHASAEAESLRGRLAAWGEGALDELRDSYPDLPAGIVDRAADVWEPLVAVADLAGGNWPERARAAAVALNAQRQERDPSLGVLLLADCRRVFEEHGADRLTTEQLLDALTGLDEAPWADLRGKPLNDRGLAKRLKKYDVRPGLHRYDSGPRRGYLLEDFHDAWLRYLPVTSVTEVTHIQRERGADGAVTPLEAEEGDDLLSISRNGSLSTPVEPLQPLRLLQPEEPVTASGPASAHGEPSGSSRARVSEPAGANDERAAPVRARRREAAGSSTVGAGLDEPELGDVPGTVGDDSGSVGALAELAAEELDDPSSSTRSGSPPANGQGSSSADDPVAVLRAKLAAVEAGE